MEIQIDCRPSYSIVQIRLEVDESIFCEPGAMAYMSSGLEVSPSLHGGMVRSIMRKSLGEESFLMTKYTGQIHGAWVALSPRYPGDISIIDVQPGEEYLIESGASLAHGEGVVIDVKYAGVRSIALREGATVLKASGSGPMIICSYGAIKHFTLQDGESLIVDTGHLVAWSARMGMRFGPLGGVVTSQLSGEGLVGELTGPGEVWVQTRAEQSIKDWILPSREQNRRS